MTTKPPEFFTSEDVEYGLQLPNGNQIWPPEAFHNTGLTTAQERAQIVEALRAASVNMGHDPEEMLRTYHWLVRPRHTYVTVVWGNPFDVPITDDHVLAMPPEPEGTEVVNGEPEPEQPPSV